MAQKGLFGAKPRTSKKNDAQLLAQRKNKKPAAQVTYISGNNLKDAVARAKTLSQRILGHVLDRLELVTDEERVEEYVTAMLENGILSGEDYRVIDTILRVKYSPIFVEKSYQISLDNKRE